nr:MAG TPA: hypothetical protein [Caudoviricetes sp.]
MGKQVTAGYGDSCTWGPYLDQPNDPRTNTEAIIKAEETAAANIRKAIRGVGISREKQDKARVELADHLIRYLCDIEVVVLMDAYLSGNKEKLFERFGTVLNDAIATKAEIDVEY